MTSSDRPNRAQGSVVALVAIPLLLAGCSGGEQRGVELAQARAGTVLQAVAAPASIEPAGHAAVAAPTAGQVAELFVRDGDQVAAGAPVLRLQSEGVDLAVAQARAGVEASSALTTVPPATDLSPLIALIRVQVEEVVPPLLSTAQATAAAIPDPNARTDALTRVAQAQANYQRAAQELARAEEQARSATSRATTAQRRVAESQRKQAEAALAAARSRQADLVVRAPTTGMVEFTHPASKENVSTTGLPSEFGALIIGDDRLGGAGGPVNVGARAVPGQTLFKIYDLSGFHVRCEVDEVDAVLITEGQSAEITVDAHPGRVFAGRVARVGIAPLGKPAGGVVYPVDVVFDGPLDAPLRVGMTASVEIVVKRVESDRIVPARALLRREGRDVVIVAEGGRAREVAVRPLAVGEEDAAVEGDVARDDHVVVAGFDRLGDGDPLPDSQEPPEGT